MNFSGSFLQTEGIFHFIKGFVYELTNYEIQDKNKVYRAKCNHLVSIDDFSRYWYIVSP